MRKGFLYDSDDYSDDLPRSKMTKKPHLIIPYMIQTTEIITPQGFHMELTFMIT